MARIVVNVMPTAEAADAEGRAALPRAAELGFDEFTRIRPGLRYVLSVPGELTEAALARARELGQHLAPVDHEVVAVYAEGATVTVASDDDDWDAYGEGIGAMAPIPEGAGRHEGRAWAHHEVDLEHAVEGYSTGVYTGEDD